MREEGYATWDARLREGSLESLCCVLGQDTGVQMGISEL